MVAGAATRRSSGRPLWALGCLGAAILVLAVSTVALFGRLGDNFFIAQAILSGCLAALATRVAERCPERQALILIAVIAVLVRIVLLAAPPLLSDDVLRYVWDGRVQAAGFNPYRYFPAAPELHAIRDETLFPHLSRADYAVTIYPPAAEALFFLVTRLHESVLLMKAVLVAFEAVTVAAVVALLRRLGLPSVRVVAYAWHPLAVWEIADNGHIDAAMAAMIVLALWLSASGKTLRAGAVATVGALFKPFALLVLPVLWRPWDWRLPLLVVVLIAIAYLPYLSAGLGVVGFLPTYIAEERLNSGSAFWVVEVLRGLVEPARWAVPVYMAGSLAILAALALRAGLRAERSLAGTVADTQRLLIAFSFLLSPDYPWYFLMVVPFVALTGSLTGWVLTVGGFVLYDVVPWDFQVPFPLRDAAFNIAVLVAMLASVRRARAERAISRTGSATT